MAISGDNFNVVYQTMCFDIVRLSKGQEMVTVDDVLCAIAPSAAHIKKEDKEAHSLPLIMRDILSFTQIHKHNYLAMNRDELTQVLKEELASNGSPAATIETDDARTYFIIDIPCHKDFVSDVLVLNEKANVVKDVVKDVVKNLTDRQQVILKLIQSDVTMTAAEMSQTLNATSRTVQRDIAELQKLGILEREGSKFNGRWVIKVEI